MVGYRVAPRTMFESPSRIMPATCCAACRTTLRWTGTSPRAGTATTWWCGRSSCCTCLTTSAWPAPPPCCAPASPVHSCPFSSHPVPLPRLHRPVFLLAVRWHHRCSAAPISVPSQTSLLPCTHCNTCSFDCTSSHSSIREGRWRGVSAHCMSLCVHLAIDADGTSNAWQSQSHVNADNADNLDGACAACSVQSTEALRTAQSGHEGGGGGAGGPGPRRRAHWQGATCRSLPVWAALATPLGVGVAFRLKAPQ